MGHPAAPGEIGEGQDVSMDWPIATAHTAMRGARVAP